MNQGLVDCAKFGCCSAMISGDCSNVMTAAVVAAEAMKVSCVMVAVELGNEKTMSYLDSIQSLNSKKYFSCFSGDNLLEALSLASVFVHDL